jgi:hypothetical protein
VFHRQLGQLPGHLRADQYHLNAAHAEHTRPDPETDVLLRQLFEAHRRAAAAVASLTS